MRKCVGCNEQSPKKELVRIVRQSGGEIHVDPTGKMNGRGAYIHPKADCLQMAKKRRSLERALLLLYRRKYMTRSARNRMKDKVLSLGICRKEPKAASGRRSVERGLSEHIVVLLIASGDYRNAWSD